MLPTVDFNDQSGAVTGELHNETSDRRLTTEAQPFQPMRPECIPQPRLSIRHLVTQGFRAAAMILRYRAVSSLFVTPLPDRFAVRPPPQGGR